MRKEYGEDRVANVVTFGTETSKSAIQTAARGLGIDIDVALYISSLIPSDRGKLELYHNVTMVIKKMILNLFLCLFNK